MIKAFRAIVLSGLCAMAAIGESVVRAADATTSDDPVRLLQSQWEKIKFGVPEGSKQTELMDALGREADLAAERFPNRVDILIWDGILTSERASMAGPFTALGLAKKARDILTKADAMDPHALDAGAPTSLGVLYYRVPGFPIGFGDTKKARQLLEEAVRIAPQGLDAWYFYGDFLYNQSEYQAAEDALHHALALPAHPDRPLWDHNRRLVIQELLTKIQARS